MNLTLVVGNTSDIANISSYHLPSIVKLQDSLANIPVLVEVYVHTLTTDPEKVKCFFMIILINIVNFTSHELFVESNGNTVDVNNHTSLALTACKYRD